MIYSPRLCIAVIFLMLVSPSTSQTFTKSSFQFSDGSELRDLIWADYDNDGDRDVFFYHDSRSRLFRNDGNDQFTEVFIPEHGLVQGAVDWGDFDNDSDADLIITGMDQGLNRIVLMENLGSDQFDRKVLDFQGFRRGGANLWRFGAGIKWVDINNDGLTDIFLCGADEFGDPRAKFILKTREGPFEESDIHVTGVFGKPSFADFDKDGDQDILIAGGGMYGEPRCIIFRNEDFKSFTELEQNGTRYGIEYGEGKWGDLNGDGYPEILLTGSHARCFINEGGEGFNPDPSWDLANLGETSGGFIDFDNDGRLEMLLSSGKNYDGNETRIYSLNEDGGLDFIHVDLPVVPDGQMAVVDIDNDGKQDVFWNGADTIQIPVIALYYNTGDKENTPPSTPDGISFEVAKGHSMLSWNQSRDGESISEALFYNLRIGSSPGAEDVYCSNADLASGYYKLSGTEGLVGANSFIIRDLPLGNYYWSVQAIDPALASSAFSSEGQFTIQAAFDEIDYDNFGGGRKMIAGDYDGDNDLDMLISGEFGLSRNTRLYENDGSGNLNEATAMGIYGSDFEWGDFDNDNDLDILLNSVIEGNEDRSDVLVYLNDGAGNFSENNFGVTGNPGATVHWDDLDNDGDLDLLISDDELDIYENLGGGVFELRYVTPRAGTSFLTVDIDNDYDKDLVLTGVWFGCTQVYENQGGLYFALRRDFCEVLRGTVSAADLDNDGWVDILATGEGQGGKYYSYIFRNKGHFNFVAEQTHIDGGFFPEVSWGDINSDGYTDLIIRGSKFRVYLNDQAGGFYEVRYAMDSNCDQWYGIESCDLDNDGSLDLALMGCDLIAQYHNNGNYGNTPPSEPSGLYSEPLGYGVLFDWAEARDDQSVAGGLSYNIRVGTTPGAYDVISPLSDPETGYRKYPGIGNAQFNTGWRIDSLGSGTYFWSVQAIDHGYAGGPWAEEKSFDVLGIEVDFDPDSLCQGEAALFTDRSIVRGRGVESWSWDFDGKGTANSQEAEFLFQDSGYHDVTLTLSREGISYPRTKKVFVSPKPLPDFQYEGSCLGATTTFLNTTETQGESVASWHWGFDDGISSQAQNPQSHGYVSQGSYNVSLKVATEYGCMDSISKVITIASSPDNEIISEGIPCRESGFALKTDEVSNYHYQWRYNEVDIPGAKGPVYSPEKEGIYSVLVSSPCGEVAASYSVNFLAGPPEPEIIIKGPEVWYLACSNDSAVEYQWYRDNERVPGETASLYVPDQPLAEYFVRISDGSECMSRSASVQLPGSFTLMNDTPLSGLSLYPNPVSGIMHIGMDNRLMGKVSLDLFSARGSKEFSTTRMKQTRDFTGEIDLEDLKPGMYFIRIGMEEYQCTRKIIIE